MVFEAFSQLGLPAPHLATSTVEPWVVVLTCVIIWLALSGGRPAPRSNAIFRA